MTNTKIERIEHKMAEDKNKTYSLLQNIYRLLFLFIGTACIAFLSIFTKCNVFELARNLIVMIMCCGFLLIVFPEQKKYLSMGQFVFAFFCGLILMCALVLFPKGCMPFAVVAFMLFLCSDAFIGIFTYTLLLVITYWFANIDISLLLFYLFIGFITILLFQSLDETYRYKVPLICTLCASLVLQFATILLQDNKPLRLEECIYPLINAFLTFVIILIYLKYYSIHVMHKYRDIYQIITDPENELLLSLKESNSKEYYHVIHTAYFADKISSAIGANNYLAKALAYYCKIGILKGSNQLKNTLEIANEKNFPPELIHALKEFGSKNVTLKSKEAAIVLIADAVITSVVFMFEKDNNVKLDYGKIVDVIIRKKMEQNTLIHCELTLNDMSVIRSIFAEEKLYYDFLR